MVSSSSGPSFRQDGSCRRAVTAYDLEREAIELVDSRHDSTQIETLQCDDACAKQNLVRPYCVTKGSHRQIVYAYETDATLHQPARTILRDGDKTLIKVGIPSRPTRRIAGAEEKALGARRDVQALQYVSRKGIHLKRVYNQGRSD
jgi:hypothetical protein